MERPKRVHIECLRAIYITITEWDTFILKHTFKSIYTQKKKKKQKKKQQLNDIKILHVFVD